MLLSLALIWSCNDYKINPQSDVTGGDSGGSPELSVDPLSLEAILCEDEPGSEQSIQLRALGAGTVTLLSASIQGTGWSLSSDPSPATLEAGETLALSVMSGIGEGTLILETEGDSRGRWEIPLSGVEDQPPTLQLQDPWEGEVIDHQDRLLWAIVGDDRDELSSLTVSWWSDQQGLLGESAPEDSSGNTYFLWPGEGRAEGDQVLEATVQDRCGSVARDSSSICQQASYIEDEIDIDSWHFEGVARWDSDNAWLELTDTSNTVVGSAFQTSTEVSGGSVSIRFQFYIGDGSGADGISLTALDIERATSYLGGSGCGIGYGGDASCTSGPALPGWSIEVDTFFNDGQDPTEADHLTFVFDGDVDDPEVWAELPEMEDNGWHLMEVEIAAPSVWVAIDGVTYIERELSGHFGFPAYVGFTAGTGGQTNRHLIDALEVTEQLCEES